jgi:hypothetical protein
VLSAGLANAEVPGVINFQGLLTDDDGTPLNGTYTATFRIYDTESEGASLWTETSDVTCEEGLFSTTLGLVNPIGLPFSEQYWLSVQLPGDEEMEPRYRLAAVPYAMRSAMSDSALTSSVADSAVVAGTALVASEVDWGDIVDIPTGFADGEDNISPAAGDGHSLNAADGDPIDIVYVHDDGNIEIGAGLAYPEIDSMRAITIGRDTLFGGYDFTIYGNGTGKRLHWDASREAFRAGQATGDEWDWTNIGFGSFSAGYNTKATGQYSTAFGAYNEVRGSYALATGYGNAAYGLYSTAMGNATYADGVYAVAIGSNTSALGLGTVAIGRNVRAIADSSMVIGFGEDIGVMLDNNTPSSLAVGFNTTTPTLFVGGPGHRVGIGTTTPAEKLDVAGAAQMTGFKLPTNAETGYMLVCTDTSGTGVWAPNLAASDGDWELSNGDIYSAVAGKVGIGTDHPTEKLDLRGTMNVGKNGSGHDVRFYGAESYGRLFWDESKMSLRAGLANNEWNDLNTGYYSFAAGVGTEASGEASIALGDSTTARGHASFASGKFTEATGRFSTAMGRGTEASGWASTALGTWTKASGSGSVAYGENTEASSWMSLAGGMYTSADGQYSAAMGHYTEALGDWSLAFGRNLTAGPAEHTIVLGKGSSHVDRLINNTEGSLMVGFDTTTPEFFVGGQYNRVGIGTGNPQSKLHLHSDGVGTNAGLMQFTNSSTGADNNDGLFIGIGSGGDALLQNMTSSSKLQLGASGNIQMTIDADGEVGIGTDSPTNELEVAGSIKMDPGAGGGCALRIAEDGDQKWALLYRPWANRVLTVFDDDGFKNVMSFELNTAEVGINTTSPESMLDIDGLNGHSQFRLRETFTPSGSGDTEGSTGNIAWDDSYIYVKTGTGWKRASLSSF